MTTEDSDVEYDVDFRENPAAYEIGRGEQGVFKIQPYKDELLPLWSISSLEEAEEAAKAIYQQYAAYLEAGDFVGADMARKYLRMGWTRSLRYAKYPGGRKYDDDGTPREPEQWYDEEKREISQVYRQHLDRVREDPAYQRLRDEWETEAG